jgi:hypothetical protein
VAVLVVEGGGLGVAEGVGADVAVGRGVERDAVVLGAGVRVGVAVRWADGVVVVVVAEDDVVPVGVGSVNDVDASGADVVVVARAEAVTAARSGDAASEAVFRQAARLPMSSTTAPAPTANDPVRLDMADEPTPKGGDHRLPDSIRAPTPLRGTQPDVVRCTRARRTSSSGHAPQRPSRGCATHLRRKPTQR